DRANRRVVLTVAGRSFLPEAARLLALAKGAAATVRRVAQGEAGTVAIGFTAASGYDFLPRALRRLRTAMPEVDFTLREGVTSVQLAALAADGLDLALARPSAGGGRFPSSGVLREPVVLALPAGHG